MTSGFIGLREPVSGDGKKHFGGLRHIIEQMNSRTQEQTSREIHELKVMNCPISDKNIKKQVRSP